MEEIWKDISSFSNYQVSNLGNVKNSKTGRILKQSMSKSGTVVKGMIVVLQQNNIIKTSKVRILVADAFIPNPDNLPYVVHIDNNFENSKLDNLKRIDRDELNVTRKQIIGKTGEPYIYYCNTKKRYAFQYKKLNYRKWFLTLEEAVIERDGYLLSLS
jgi:hypothetical protein